MPIRPAISRHPVVIATAALVVVGSAIFVLAYFEPQKLFIDDRVNEPLPTAPASPKNGPSSGAALRSAVTWAGEADDARQAELGAHC